MKKRKYIQDELSKVKWFELESDNSCMFKYLVSYFEAGGTHMSNVRIHITTTEVWFDNLRHI